MKKLLLLFMFVSAAPAFAMDIFGAVQRGDRKQVRALLDAGTDVDVQNDDELSPLFLAIDNADVGMVDLLLHRGANVRTQGVLGMNAMDVANMNNNAQIAQMLNDEHVFRKNNPGKPMDIYRAVKRGNRERVKTLLDTGTNIDSQNEDDFTPLLLAIDNGDKAMVGLLLDRGADLVACGFFNMKPIDAAHLNGNQDIIDMLKRESIMRSSGFRRILGKRTIVQALQDREINGRW